MAPELDMGMGMGFGNMGMEAAAASSSAAYMYGLPSTDTLRIDDLLDFSNQDDLFDATTTTDIYTHQQHHLLPQIDPPAGGGGGRNMNFPGVTQLDSFSDDLYIPCEEAAELEWLSKFVEDSFSDVPFPSSQSNDSGGPPSTNHNAARTDSSAVPGRARSKRSRAPAAALHHHTASITNWSSLPPHSTTSPSSSASASSSSSSSSEFPTGSGGRKKKEVGGVVASAAGVEGGVRRCTHCSSEKTPQWRTGPLGPKTLCNACGVRYKSGRLVPEYRPAASPTFVLTQHSNSHRKVMELRRQKELLLHNRHNHPANVTTYAATAGGGASPAHHRPELLFHHDYEVC